ncbi:hypothetical protein GCM10020219_103420 [Nonomuraea dietziae]
MRTIQGGQRNRCRDPEAGIGDRSVPGAKETLTSIIFSTSPGDWPADSAPVDTVGSKESVSSAGSFSEVVIQSSPARRANRGGAGPE